MLCDVLYMRVCMHDYDVYVASTACRLFAISLCLEVIVIKICQSAEHFILVNAPLDSTQVDTRE